MAVMLISGTGVPVKLNDLIDYDPEAGVLTWRSRPRELFTSLCAWRTWNSRYSGKPALASCDRKTYLIGAIFDRMHKAHRVAWAIYYGEWPSQFIDHIDGNPANNRISNLRLASNSVNLQNARRRSDNTSGVMGVSWRRDTGKWDAYINVANKRIRLGSFRDLGDAINARHNAEKKYGFHENHGRDYSHPLVAASSASA